MGPATRLAKETPHKNTAPPKKSLFLRPLKFLRALEQAMIGEIIALTSPRNHLE